MPERAASFRDACLDGCPWTSVEDFFHVRIVQSRAPALHIQVSLSVFRCQNAKGEEFVVSWVKRGENSVLPKKKSGCVAFQQLMTMMDHPYIMPCVAAA